MFCTVLGLDNNPLLTCEHASPDDSDRVACYINIHPAHGHARLTLRADVESRRLDR
jgi:hypothetical protein